MMRLSMPSGSNINAGEPQRPQQTRFAQQFAQHAAPAPFLMVPSSPVAVPQALSSSLSSQSDHSTKRSRRDSAEESSDLDSVSFSEPAGASSRVSLDSTGTPSKRNRSNKYTSPTEIPKTLISSMGTLAAPPPSASLGSLPPVRNNLSARNPRMAGSTQVPVRRQLSGGRIEAFLGAGGSNSGDAMDTEPTTCTHSPRPRSMSF